MKQQISEYKQKLHNLTIHLKKRKVGKIIKLTAAKGKHPPT